MVVLIDESSSSDAEGFARGVKDLGLGRLIGTRTWGGKFSFYPLLCILLFSLLTVVKGGIWLSSDNVLVDGGMATAPEYGTFDLQHGWGSGIEQQGVTPDIYVDNDPVQAFSGIDTQLEMAVDELARWLHDEPVAFPPLPGSKPDMTSQGAECPA